MKNAFILVLSLLLILSVSVGFAADDGADPLKADELHAWADEIRALAASSELQNDPHDEAAHTEDGYAYVYDFGILYYDTPDFSDTALLNAFVLYNDEMTCLRGTAIDQSTDEILNAFYNENENLAGSNEAAVLYLNDEMPTGASWGWILRDGQRISSIQYSVCDQPATGGDGYQNTGILYTIQENTVVAIRVYGLSEYQDSESTIAEIAGVRAAAEHMEYTAYPQSTDGSKLTMFSAADVIVDGFDVLQASPEELIAYFGKPVTEEYLDNGDGYLYLLSYDSFIMIYTTDSKKKNAAVSTVELTSDLSEGPRGVRIGDSLNSVLFRFRFGEYELSGTQQRLYGVDEIAPYGICEYGTDASADIRYAAALEDGTTVMLSLHFEMLELTDILINIL